MKKMILTIALVLVASLRLNAEVKRVTNGRNQSLTVDSGAAQTIMLPDTAMLNGHITVKPSTLIVTSISWSASGPGAVVFSAAQSAANVASFTVAGTYILTLSASTAKMHASANVTITVNPAVVQPPPPPPVVLNNLGWGMVAGADYYDLYKTDGGCDDPTTFVKANAQPIMATVYSDDPHPAAALCYYVIAVNAAGKSGPSNIIWVQTK